MTSGLIANTNAAKSGIGVGILLILGAGPKREIQPPRNLAQGAIMRRGE